MEWLQTMLDNSTTPALTALLLGLLTALSPCPLATNIAAIGYIGKDIEDGRKIFLKGLCYTLGRVISYTALGVVLIAILREGASVFGIQKALGKWGELLLGPMLMVVGLLMLFGHQLNLPKLSFGHYGERIARRGILGALLLGIIFALAFCPTSGVLYFGMLIPMSVAEPAGWMLPIVFAIATAIPVLIVAWILAFSARHLGAFYGKMQRLQKWLNVGVGVLFLLIGIYYCVVIYL
ncbi:MAG: aromatic aminobenezylarsenical efflux permease ArsG family transporter [Sodaliphilus sp.]